MLSFNLLNTALDSLWGCLNTLFVQMVLKEYLAMGVLEIDILPCVITFADARRTCQ